MRGFGLVGTVLSGLTLLSVPAQAQSTSSIDPIIVKGRHFFYSTNHTQFYIKGVAYQQDFVANGTILDSDSYTDPLADTTRCQDDIQYLSRLGINVIRTYAVNPSSDHTTCMNALADAGIYVISDLSAPTTTGSINRDDPEWTTTLFSRYTQLVDDLSKFPNLLGFFAGNEVANSENTTAAAAFVKAAVRDTKAYIAQANVGRPMYVGYATSDDETIRDQMAQYMNCDPDVANNVDFFGYNIYSWCGMSTYQQSGYAERTTFFQDYSVPVFFAEYGCNSVEPRPFTEVTALYGDQMTDVWSGGIAYQYFETTNNYGLVNLDGNTISTRQDYDNLSSQLAKVSPTSTAYAAAETTMTPTTCPSVASTWSSTPSPLPRTPNEDLCRCAGQSFGCAVKASTSEDDYADNFAYICNPNRGGDQYCAGIAHNATTGTYGAYGMCNAATQLSFVMNRYYQANKASNPSACGFGGAAATKATSAPSGTCASLLNAAGNNGGGAVGSGSPSTDGNDGGSSSSGNAAAMSLPSPDKGLVYLALYVAGAAGVGAGMLML